MNLRILKKLSKKAAPLLAGLGDKREQFIAERGENYSAVRGHDRKHWERTRSIHDGPLFEGEIILHRPPTFSIAKRSLPFLRLRDDANPWPGTVMVGSREGYDEPEWVEADAWDALLEAVWWRFTDYDPETDGMVTKRRLHNPKQYLTAAREIAA